MDYDDYRDDDLEGYPLEDDICRNKHKGNPESEEANLRTNKEIQRWRIIEAFKPANELIAEQVEKLTGMRRSTVSARVSELKRDGILMKTGERRPTSTGCNAAVLRLRRADEVVAHAVAAASSDDSSKG